MLSVLGWKFKFIFVREGLFYDRHPGLVTCFRHGLGTFSFPFLLEPFDVALRSCLLRYPVEAQTYLEPILYLDGLPCSWEGSPMHSNILVDGHDSTPLFVGRPDIHVVNLSDEEIEMQADGSAGADVDIPSPCVRRAMPAPILVNFSPKRKEVMVSSSYGSKRKRLESSGGSGPSPIFIGRRTIFLSPLASSRDTREADPFLQGDDEAWVSHDILSSLLHPETQRRSDGLSLNELANFHDVSALKFMMSSNMLNREARSLSVEVLRLRDEVVTLRNQRANSAIVRAVMLAIEASLSVVLEVLKEKLDLDNEDHSLMVTDLPPHAVKTLLSSDSFSAMLAGLQEKAMFIRRGQALKEVADMGIGLRLEDMRDYKSDAKETYDKAIDDFY
ncbi:hypothetical protein Tco_0636003 [Tanacetum coccineum]